MAVETFLSTDYDEPDEPFYDEIPESESAYMDICGPALQNNYMSVEATSVYMDVAPHYTYCDDSTLSV